MSKNLYGTDDGATTEELNLATFNDYKNILMQMAMSIYKWVGLPPEIDKRYMELSLLEKGLSVFFYDIDFDKHFALQGTASAAVNMVQNPTGYCISAPGGFNRDLIPYNAPSQNIYTPENAQLCVPIWDNYLRKSKMTTINRFARQLASIDRTIDVQLMHQKTPVFVSCSEKQRLTVENLLRGVAANRPFVVANDITGLPSISYINNNSPYLVDKLLIDQSKIWAKAMTFIGINNSNMDKKERLVESEVDGNDEQICASRTIGLDCRREACLQMRAAFPGSCKNVWVVYNSDIDSELYESTQLANNGEEE